MRSPSPPAEQRFAALYRAHALAVLGYALRRVEPREQAADVVAEVFTVAWRRLDDVPAGDGARPWLFGVARLVLANHRRGVLRANRLADRLRAELAVDGPRPAPHVDVHAALAELDAADRELLTLTSWEGLTPAEIAAATGLSNGAVRVRLHRARQRLAASLIAGRERRTASSLITLHEERP